LKVIVENIFIYFALVFHPKTLVGMARTCKAADKMMLELADTSARLLETLKQNNELIKGQNCYGK